MPPQCDNCLPARTINEIRTDYQRTHEGYHEVKLALAVATEQMKTVIDAQKEATARDEEIFGRLSTVERKVETKITNKEAIGLIAFALMVAGSVVGVISLLLK